MRRVPLPCFWGETEVLAKPLLESERCLPTQVVTNNKEMQWKYC